MIILNRWFHFAAPRRYDLSGFALGFFLIILPRSSGDRFGPLRGTQFSFHWPFAPWRRGSKLEEFECVQLIRTQESYDWRDWPEGQREASEAAVRRKLEELGKVRIVSDRSSCNRRIDLSDTPWQLWRCIAVERIAA